MATPMLLFVDDNEMLRTFAARNLESDIPNLRVVGAGTCEEARARAEETRPRVVVLDHRLSDGTGLELMRELMRGLPGARMVIVSADARTTLRERALEAGAFEVLAKPYETESLVAVVRRALDGAEAEASAGGARPSVAPSRARHLAMNRLSALLAGLRAMEADLEDVAGECRAVERVSERYLPRMRAIVTELSELIATMGSDGSRP